MPYKNRPEKQAKIFWDSLAFISARTFILVLLIFLLLLASTLPIKIGHISQIRPAFFVIVIYYMSIFKPRAFPPLAVFTAGLLLDLLTACPLGLNALILVSLQWFIRMQRPFLAGQSFLVLWMGFFLVTALIFVFEWTIFSIFHWQMVPALPMIVSALLTGLLFPLAAWILNTANKLLSQDSSTSV